MHNSTFQRLAPPPLVAERHTSEGSAPGSTPIVLVIDDSLTVRRLLEVSLRRAGLDVISYPDGLQALAALRRPGNRLPDVVLLDVGLPRMDGYQVARLLRTYPHCAAIPLLMLSGLQGVVDRLKGRLAGASAYLAKPFQIEALLAVIQTHLAQHTSTPRSTGRPLC